MYDIIGDIHGHAAELKLLLEKLGYRNDAGSYSHPARRVLFCGDFIDRGPEIMETLRLVRQMCDSGAAQAASSETRLMATSSSRSKSETASSYSGSTVVY